MIPGWRWLWAIGLGVPLLLGVVLAIGAGVSWITGSEYERPDALGAGPISEFDIAAPILFEEDDVWVVRLPDEEFLALYDRGLEDGCPLQWRREFEFMDRTGWFVDACTGSAYDLTGRCFSDACRGQLLSRFPTTLSGGTVSVDLKDLERDLPPDPAAAPINPEG